jgi:hypothetical protein
MSADTMRRFLDIVEGSTDFETFFADPSARQVLSEGAVLTEGAYAEKIKAAMAKVTGRFGKATPQLLAQVAQKAEGLYGGNDAVLSTLARIKALGRSPALLAPRTWPTRPIRSSASATSTRSPAPCRPTASIAARRLPQASPRA